jgi:hypothetical protein
MVLGRCKVSLLSKWEKMLCTFWNHSDATHLATAKTFFLGVARNNLSLGSPPITHVPDLTEGSSVCTSGTLRRKGEYWQSPTQKYFAGIGLCCHDREMSAKSANIWLLGQHVANIPSQAACERQFLCCAVHEECFFTQKGPEWHRVGSEVILKRPSHQKIMYFVLLMESMIWGPFTSILCCPLGLKEMKQWRIWTIAASI